jgi:hypothetical protein
MDILEKIQDIVDHAPDSNTAIEWVRDYLEEKADRMVSREYAKQMIARSEDASNRAHP